MKRMWLLTILLGVWPGPGMAQTTEELVNDGKNRFPQAKPGDLLGHFVAINPLTGEKAWEIPLTDFPSSAGMLATGGGLVFTGKMTGEFIGLDEASGLVWWVSAGAGDPLSLAQQPTAKRGQDA